MDNTRYTFAKVVYLAAEGGGRTYYGPGEYPLKPWCKTARGAWDYVKHAAPVMGGETIRVYRDGRAIGEYGRPNFSKEVLEWFGDDQGWGPVRIQRGENVKPCGKCGEVLPEPGHTC